MSQGEAGRFDLLKIRICYYEHSLRIRLNGLALFVIDVLNNREGILSCESVNCLFNPHKLTGIMKEPLMTCGFLKIKKH